LTFWTVRKIKIWSKLDLVDGFHQIPLKGDHRHFTCTPTPKGVFQWTVLVMGLRNAGGQFQRMMESVFKDTPNVDPHIDDVTIGSTGANLEELVPNHLADVTQVLEVMEKNQLICSQNKSTFLLLEVECS